MVACAHRFEFLVKFPSLAVSAHGNAVRGSGHRERELPGSPGLRPWPDRPRSEKWLGSKLVKNKTFTAEYPPKTQRINSLSFTYTIFNNKNTWTINACFSSLCSYKATAFLKSVYTWGQYNYRPSSCEAGAIRGSHGSCYRAVSLLGILAWRTDAAGWEAAVLDKNVTAKQAFQQQHLAATTGTHRPESTHCSCSHQRPGGRAVWQVTPQKNTEHNEQWRLSGESRGQGKRRGPNTRKTAEWWLLSSGNRPMGQNEGETRSLWEMNTEC